ncbi:MAG: hypothetical protein Tp152SUR00d2C52646391_67 [Prokaryotic dsDNA virus sp.]|nr:MAG: hypothetical protein Tp152SUR00d2C52646391_67 [Prokaryotic dsDNA virus sp.]|tara:strand:+ start:4919 stop:5119 length:201 start_codon:yes stop_codon:yes gene_type:complete
MSKLSNEEKIVEVRRRLPMDGKPHIYYWNGHWKCLAPVHGTVFTNGSFQPWLDADKFIKRLESNNA